MLRSISASEHVNINIGAVQHRHVQVNRLHSCGPLLHIGQVEDIEASSSYTSAVVTD